MTENKLVGSLVLRTIDIEPTRTRPTPSSNQAVDNDFGICDANGAYITWKNVNISDCLGELYKNYNRFNLKMAAAQIGQNTAAALADAQTLVYIDNLKYNLHRSLNQRI